MVYESQLKGINKKEYGHGTLVHLYNMDIEIRMYFLYFSSSFFKFLDKGKKGLTSCGMFKMLVMITQDSVMKCPRPRLTMCSSSS